MKAYIFMNHNIHGKAPAGKHTEPVITVQIGKKRIHANEVAINGPSDVKTGHLLHITSHEVKAWVECEANAVQVIS